MATSSPKLDTLPHEILALIAFSSDALAALQLSSTCKAIRSACWDSIVFKGLLEKSQKDFWCSDSLDLAAIAEQAAGDINIWARYTIADRLAKILATEEDPLASTRSPNTFLPGLAVVRHPFLQHSYWPKASRDSSYRLNSHNALTYTLALLSAGDQRFKLFHEPRTCGRCKLTPGRHTVSSITGDDVLWTLCTVASILHEALRMRRSAWPYNESALVPFIDLPVAKQIPLKPLDASYHLPVPWNETAFEDLDHGGAPSSSWAVWYRLHNYALFASPDFLTSGTWCGYYVHACVNPRLEPPMTGIRFRRGRTTSSALSQSVFVEATDCRDGIASFDIRGQLTFDGDVVTMTATKEYKSVALTWHWKCRLTPFGLIGYWGYETDSDLGEQGYVWLWKSEWTS